MPDQKPTLDYGRAPFLDISMVGQKDFDYFVNRFFAVDRLSRAKGMIEVIG